MVKYYNSIDELPQTYKNMLSEDAQYTLMHAFNRYVEMYIEDAAWELAWQECEESGFFDEVYKSKGDFVHITKSNDDKQFVFGWANIAKNADGSIPMDWQDDVTTPAELEKAAYNFVLKYRETGEMHEGEAKGQLIESIMFTKEKMEALGIPEGTVPEGWWVGFYIPDSEVFQKIKDGTYKMFSIQGVGKRIKL